MRRLWVGLIGVILAGCVDGWQSQHAVVVPSDTLTTEDFVVVGSAIVQSMSNSPALNQQPPANMQLGVLSNETMLSLDTETLLARATVNLLKSARVEQWNASNDSKPELSLRGRIYEVRKSAGKLRPQGYYIRLTLMDLSTGAYLWSEERRVQKRPKPKVDNL